MTTRQDGADFQVVYKKNGILQLALKIDKNEASELDRRYTFTVVNVQPECLLLYYGPFKEKLDCFLWGFHYETIENTSCYSKMKEVCRDDMRNLFEDDGPCKNKEAANKDTTPEDENKEQQKETWEKEITPIVPAAAVVQADDPWNGMPEEKLSDSCSDLRRAVEEMAGRRVGQRWSGGWNS
nr:uncharacterized protein LOC119169851 [Rhipicephalus microplus]